MKARVDPVAEKRLAWALRGRRALYDDGAAGQAEPEEESACGPLAKWREVWSLGVVGGGCPSCQPHDRFACVGLPSLVLTIGKSNQINENFNLRGSAAARIISLDESPSPQKVFFA
jgi:hypothetical protein